MNPPINKARATAIASTSLIGDELSVLFSDCRHPMAKTWQIDGTVKQYRNAKYFELKKTTVKDIRGLSELLKRLEGLPNACLIRGKYVGDDIAKERTSGEYRPGNVLRRNDIFEDQPLQVILIEVDEFEPEFTDPNTDPLGSIHEYIHRCLPGAFTHASYHWQLSN